MGKAKEEDNLIALSSCAAFLPSHVALYQSQGRRGTLCLPPRLSLSPFPFGYVCSTDAALLDVM